MLLFVGLLGGGVLYGGVGVAADGVGLAVEDFSYGVFG